MDSPSQSKRIKLEHNTNDEFNGIRIRSLYITPITPDVSCNFIKYSLEACLQFVVQF